MASRLLTLNRPERGNGVVPEMARDLLDAIARLEQDLAVRVLVLTGAGQQFCAGADLVEFQRYIEEQLADQPRALQTPRVLWPVTQRLVACRMPVIAAINGGATAGGLDLALACDIRIASTQAKLGETYIKLGLNPGNGGTYFLPRLVGSGLAAELAFTGDIVDAQRAAEIGLVNRVVAPDAPAQHRHRLGLAHCRLSQASAGGDQAAAAPELAPGPGELDDRQLLGRRDHEPHRGSEGRHRRRTRNGVLPASTSRTTRTGRNRNRRVEPLRNLPAAFGCST